MSFLGSLNDGIPRQKFASYGIVDAQTSDGDKPVTFDPKYGPLVDVKLQPSANHVRCRVSSRFAGRGEGAYYPFIDGDEVLVLMPEGDEKGDPVIIDRLNNEIDEFPTVVAGNDATSNKFGFHRIRAPFITEFASAYLMRNAITGSLLNFGADGTITIKDGYSDIVHLGPDFVGIQATDDTTDSPFAAPGSALMVVQLNKKDTCIDIQIQGDTQLKLAKDNSYLATNGTFAVQTAGMPAAAEHVTTIEAVVNVLNGVLLGLSVPPFSTPGGLSNLADITQRSGLIAAAIATCVTPSPVGGVVSPVIMTAISAALTTKLPNPTGTTPNVGCPGFLAT